MRNAAKVRANYLTSVVGAGIVEDDNPIWMPRLEEQAIKRVRYEMTMVEGRHDHRHRAFIDGMVFSTADTVMVIGLIIGVDRHEASLN